MLPWVFAISTWWLTRSFLMALLGYGVGIWLSRQVTLSGQRTDYLFFTTTFAVMGHLAKATGRVTKDDIALANQWMHFFQLTPARRHDAQRAFYQGMQSDYGWQAAVLALQQRYRFQPSLLSLFLEIQVRTALNDDVIQTSEQVLLQHMAQLLGVSRSQLNILIRQCQCRQQPSAVSSSQAYDILGLEPTCTASDLKRAYRRLMKQYHPDKMIAQGMPKEMIDVAKEKVQTIQQAYDHLKQHHKAPAEP